MGEPLFAGAVLTGGASRRMGRDKATLPIGGVPMAVRVAEALRAAGAAVVAMVGAAVEREVHVADQYPGDGPLGGILSALRWSTAPLLVVAPCDLVAPDPAAFAALVSAVAAGTRLAAIGALNDPIPIVLRRAAEPVLAAVFAGGERSLRRAVVALDPLVVELAPAALADADTRDELPPGAG